MKKTLIRAASILAWFTILGSAQAAPPTSEPLYASITHADTATSITLLVPETVGEKRTLALNKESKHPNVCTPRNNMFATITRVDELSVLLKWSSTNCLPQSAQLEVLDEYFSLFNPTPGSTTHGEWTLTLSRKDLGFEKL